MTTNTNMDYDTTTGATTVRDSASHTNVRHDLDRRISSETKPSFKTSELAVYVLAVLGVLIASAVVDVRDFGAQEAWFYVTLLTIGYMVSRGLAKSGSRDYYDDYADNDH